MSLSETFQITDVGAMLNGVYLRFTMPATITLTWDQREAAGSVDGVAKVLGPPHLTEVTIDASPDEQGNYFTLNSQNLTAIQEVAMGLQPKPTEGEPQ